MIPTDDAEALVSYLRTVVGLKVTLTHAGTVAVKPKQKLTDEIRAAIDEIGIPAIQATLRAERVPVERVPADTRPERPGKVQDLMQDARAAWAIIRQRNDPPRLFRRAGLVWIESDDLGRPAAVPLDSARVTHYLAEEIYFTVERTIGDTTATVPVPPPAALVRDLLATPDPPLPTLARIVTAPVLTPTGELHERPGYDPASRAFYAPPPGFVVPPVPREPAPAEMTAARELLEEVVCDFPFVSDADLANALALMVTPFVRDLIAGPTPLFLVRKPAQGTGASLLAEAIAQLATGTAAEAYPDAREDEEWRKRLTTILRAAPALVIFDNLTGILRSPGLSAALTGLVWKDRALGSNEEVAVPIRCTWVATANNLLLGADMIRRVVPINLDAKVERPWLRARDGLVKFRHPRLLDWVQQERPRLVHAALTLARGWIAAGRPKGTETMASFEAWAVTLGGILGVAGVGGFLANVDDLYEQSDIDGDEARRFVAAWWEAFQEDSKSPADLFALGKEVALTLSGQSDHAQRCAFGRFLDRHRGRPWAINDALNVTITKPSTAAGRPRWRLVASNGHRGEPGDSGESFIRTRACAGNPNGVHISGGDGTAAGGLSPDSRLSQDSSAEELDL